MADSPTTSERYARLVASSLGDPDRFSGAGRRAPRSIGSDALRPAEPIARLVMGPLPRISCHASTAGSRPCPDRLRRGRAARRRDPPALEGAAVGGRLGDSCPRLVWYVRTQRACRRLACERFLARLSAGDASRDARAGCARASGGAPAWRSAGRAHALRLTSPARGSPPCGCSRAPPGACLFDSLDPGCLGRPIDVRHPLLDLRLIRFALGLPAVPWCVNKHLLRRCLDGFPAAGADAEEGAAAVDPDAEMFRKVDPRALRVRWQCRRAGAVSGCRLDAARAR